MPMTPPMARAEALLGHGARGGVVAGGRGARLGGGLEHRALVRGVRGDGVVELGHEIGAPPQLRVDVAPGASACGCARGSGGCRAGSRWRRRRRTSATTIQISTQRGYQRSEAGSIARRLALERAGIEALTSSAGVQGSGAREQAGAVREPADERARIGARRAQLLRPTAPWRLARRSPSSPSSSGTWA